MDKKITVTEIKVSLANEGLAKLCDIGSGYGCDLSGGHAIARCADYDQSSVTVVRINFNHKRVQQHIEIKYNKKGQSSNV